MIAEDTELFVFLIIATLIIAFALKTLDE